MTVSLKFSIRATTALTACTLAFASAAFADTIKIGVIQPQAGDCAQWGIPISRGVMMWADEMNAKGGVELANGAKEKIEVKTYDNVCYAPGDELKAARRAVLDDGAQYVLQTYTPAARQAIADLTNERKVVSVSYGAGFLSGKYPFMFGAMTGSPTSYMLVADRIIAAHPEAKRIAIISADNSFAKSSKAYAEAGIAPHGDAVQIVYNQSYSSDAAGDMLSLLSPLMEAQPDIIIEAGFVPSQQAQMVEILDQLGFKGYFGSEAWNLNFMTERLGADRIAGRLYSGYGLDASEASLSPRVAEFYKNYVAKYGEKEWSVFASISYATVATLEAGFKLSKSAAPADFVEAVHASPTLDHPLFGKSTWAGEDVFGINNHLYTPLPIYNVGADGKIVLDKVEDVNAWWQKNKAAALPVLQKENQVYK